MTKNRAMRTAIGLLTVGVLLLAGCRSAPGEHAADDAQERDPDGQTTNDPESTEEEPAAPELTVAFTGDGCDYDGATTTPAGMHTITTDNAHPERTLTVVINRLNDGYDYEDFLEWFGDARPQVARSERPPFINAWGPVNFVRPGTQTTVNHNLNVGNHAVVCWLRGPPGNGHAWPVTSLIVTDGEPDA
jgi:hypothetical protein